MYAVGEAVAHIVEAAGSWGEVAGIPADAADSWAAVVLVVFALAACPYQLPRRSRTSFHMPLPASVCLSYR